MSSAEQQRFKMGIVTASTRVNRVNPYITQYIRDWLEDSLQHTIFKIIDLKEHSLPFFDEATLPAHHPASNPTPHYEHECARKWSAVIRQYDGFIFATPQYNWSIPASLKNALDYLFHEWVGKPAMVVAYGGRGGGKAAAHLTQILAGLRMTVIEPAVLLTISVDDGQACVEAGELIEEVRERWTEASLDEEIKKSVTEMHRHLALSRSN
jgi:NAD(P)H-dependent FMN reductase